MCELGFNTIWIIDGLAILIVLIAFVGSVWDWRNNLVDLLGVDFDSIFAVAAVIVVFVTILGLPVVSELCGYK